MTISSGSGSYRSSLILLQKWQFVLTCSLLKVQKLIVHDVQGKCTPKQALGSARVGLPGRCLTRWRAQGNYSDLLVQLSNIYSQLRGDTSGQKNEDSAQGFVRSTTKYWVSLHSPSYFSYVRIQCAENSENAAYGMSRKVPVFGAEPKAFWSVCHLLKWVDMHAKPCSRVSSACVRRQVLPALRV